MWAADAPKEDDTWNFTEDGEGFSFLAVQKRKLLGLMVGWVSPISDMTILLTFFARLHSGCADS